MKARFSALPVSLLWLLGITGMLFLQGCTANRYNAYFEDYEKDYKQRVSYTNHRIQRDGMTIFAREYGVRNNKPTYVLLHGFPDSLHLYDRLAPFLAKDRHIVAFDFIGWGDSDKPLQHRYDVDSLKRDIEAVVDYFGLNSVVLVMHDASGQPGIDWALEHPDKTAGLVLLDMYYSLMPTLKAPEAIDLFSTPGIRRDLSVWATRHSERLWLSRFKAQIARFISNDEQRPRFLKLFAHQSLAIRPAFYGLNRVLRQELKKRQGKQQQLRYFQAPVRIIFGQQDPYMNEGVARSFHALFPHSELFMIQHAGHFVQIDQPEKVAALLRDFPSRSHSNQ